MNVDELQALEAAIAAVATDKTFQIAEYWIDLEDGHWQIQTTERVTWINASTGRMASRFLDPLSAFAAARSYAQEHSLRWKPSFTLSLKLDHWIVGSCRSQFGGQTYIYVAHDGSVRQHSVNPK